MINVTVSRRGGEYLYFESRGHAGFGEAGRDIICSAVSALVINTVNSIDEFTEDVIHVVNEDGFLSWEFLTGMSPESGLLMDSLVLGLTQIQENYKGEYLKITIKEV